MREASALEIRATLRREAKPVTIIAVVATLAFAIVFCVLFFSGLPESTLGKVACFAVLVISTPLSVYGSSFALGFLLVFLRYRRKGLLTT